MENRKIRVAITHGDTNGIGYEVILKAFEDSGMLDMCTPIIYGSPKIATYHRNVLQLETPFTIISKAEEAHPDRLNLLATFDDEVKVEFGSPTSVSAEAARKALQRAKEDLKNGLYDVLVQAPVVSSRTPDPDDKSLLIMFADDIRIALATNHLPIKDVATSITSDKLVEKCQLLHTSLKRDFRINNPRIAVLALNPQLGAEEENIISPALKTVEEAGIQAYGPYTADDFFGNDLQGSFDGILAMYDDQGNVPFKTLSQEYGVKLKAGITAICTTPDHGPAFDIAGKGIASEQSLRHAIYTAIDMYRHRNDYDEPLAHPLPKLYHEKREDGDKARFAVRIPPKKGEETVPESMED
jgi:4-hydroxythreonine-4-phosphate dehydrogenase